MDGGTEGSGDEGAQIIAFPDRTCYDCQHAYFGVRGVFCDAWREHIVDEKAAARDCEVYDPT